MHHAHHFTAEAIRVWKGFGDPITHRRRTNPIAGAERTNRHAPQIGATDLTKMRASIQALGGVFRARVMPPWGYPEGMKTEPDRAGCHGFGPPTPCLRRLRHRGSEDRTRGT